MDVVSPATVNSQLSQGKEEYKKRQKKAQPYKPGNWERAQQRITEKIYSQALLLLSPPVHFSDSSIIAMITSSVQVWNNGTGPFFYPDTLHDQHE